MIVKQEMFQVQVRNLSYLFHKFSPYNTFSLLIFLLFVARWSHSSEQLLSIW